MIDCYRIARFGYGQYMPSGVKTARQWEILNREYTEIETAVMALRDCRKGDTASTFIVIECRYVPRITAAYSLGEGFIDLLCGLPGGPMESPRLHEAVTMVMDEKFRRMITELEGR